MGVEGADHARVLTRINVLIWEDQRDAIKRLALRDERTQAQVLRRALDLGLPARPRRPEELAGVAS